jgi:uncharacterized protein (DUF342 family)
MSIEIQEHTKENFEETLKIIQDEIRDYDYSICMKKEHKEIFPDHKALMEFLFNMLVNLKLTMDSHNTFLSEIKEEKKYVIINTNIELEGEVKDSVSLIAIIPDSKVIFFEEMYIYSLDNVPDAALDLIAKTFKDNSDKS